MYLKVELIHCKNTSQTRPEDLNSIDLRAVAAPEKIFEGIEGVKCIFGEGGKNPNKWLIWDQFSLTGRGQVGRRTSDLRGGVECYPPSTLWYSHCLWEKATSGKRVLMYT